MNKIDKLKNIIDESKNIVFFGGAGVSTTSGLKDFRSKDGIYNMKYPYPPEEILSHHFFINNTKEFFKFYKSMLNTKGIEPNIIHKYLVELEKDGKLKAIITQNIDNLHTLAGSKKVLELHGNINRNYCIKCNKFYDGTFVFNSSDDIPHCSCGGIIKPDVVLYEEPLNNGILSFSIDYITNAETLIIGGTSLVVYPAAGLINYFKGKNLVLINKSETQYDNLATLVINDAIGETLRQIKV